MKLIVFFSSLLLIWVKLAQAQELDRVFIIHRHGHRNPLRFYPTHPNFTTTDKAYFGKLTAIGETQASNLGNRLGSLYRSLLNVETIQPNSVYARSSQSSRTIKTGKLVLEALLKVKDYDLISIPYTEDYVISQFGPCKKFEEEYVQMRNNVPLIYKEMLQSYKTKLVALEKPCGVSLASIKNAGALYDTILCEAEGGNQLPYWAGQVYPDGLSELAAAFLKMMTHSPYMLKEKSGPLIEEIRAFMNKEADQGDYKLKIYSAHDSTLVTLAKAFDVEGQFPRLFKFTDTLAFELYKDEEGEELLKIRYFPLDKPEHEIFPAKCNQGGKHCTKAEFNEITKNLVVKDIKAFCENPIDYTYSPEFLATFDLAFDQTSWNDTAI